MSASSKLRVLVADDHDLVRRAIAKSLSDHFDVCGEATNGVEAAEKVRTLKPDVVVMDVSMPVLNGIDASRLIRGLFPQVKIVALSMYDSPTMIDLIKTIGLDAFVSKRSPFDDLTKTLERFEAA